ncbi:MAG TPA: flagellar filament capping protein FliD [Terriglobia bacterium]|nr:flagellar filament capping protein FliD [Terriglobia bacterium]
MAAVTLSGFNNIDFQSIVKIIIQAERQPIDRLQADQKTEQSRLTAYQNLTSALTRIEDAFAALKAPTAFGDLSAASSDSSILKVSATSAASRGTFSINVTSLARPQVTASAVRQFDDINADIIDGGAFSITQGGTTTGIDLTGVTTLTQLRDAINAHQASVKAAIINDGSSLDSPTRPFRLVLTSASSGAAAGFTVDDQTSFGGGAAGSVLNLSTDPTSGTALDTQLQYNGIPITSSSTTVSGAIPGLTLNVLKTGTSVVTVDNDQTPLKSKLTEVVNAFNAFNDFVQAQSKLPAQGAARSPLSTDPLLRSLNRQLRNYLTSNQASSGSFRNLAALGFKVDQAGKLSIDNAILDRALTGNLDDVKAFFVDASGFAARVGDAIEGFNSSIQSVESRVRETISSYGKRIAAMEGQLALREDSLTRQFAAADQAISQLNSQSNALNSLSSLYKLY